MLVSSTALESSIIGVSISLIYVFFIAISYDKAKSHLWLRTSQYLSKHFEKEENSRPYLFPMYNKKGKVINNDTLIELSFDSIFSKEFAYWYSRTNCFKSFNVG